jgi:hypothetical protein
MEWPYIVLIVLGSIFLILLVVYFVRRNNTENYQIARDEASTKMFDQLMVDLKKIYPHDLSKINMKGLVSCIPEDSYTENKKHVCICLRNKNGNFYPYSKLLKIGIHELAHVISKQHDPEHKTPEFINNYASLMNKAKELGLHVE